MSNTTINKTINITASIVVFFISLLFFPIIGIVRFYKSLKGTDFAQEAQFCLYENPIDKASKAILNFSSSLILILLKMIFMPFVLLYKAIIKSSQTNRLFRELLSANID